MSQTQTLLKPLMSTPAQWDSLAALARRHDADAEALMCQWVRRAGADCEIYRVPMFGDPNPVTAATMTLALGIAEAATADLHHAVVIRGQLYAHGDTRENAMHNFRQQISGALPAMRAHFHQRAKMVQLTPEQASEVAEMLAADVIEWIPPPDED